MNPSSPLGALRCAAIRRIIVILSILLTTAALHAQCADVPGLHLDGARIKQTVENFVSWAGRAVDKGGNRSPVRTPEERLP
jgi:hypothetical protein